MNEIFPFLGHWVWWVLAGFLLIIELLAPGIFFLWLALAAGLTGLADMIFGLPWQAEGLIFAVLSVISVMAGRSLYGRRSNEPADNRHLNRRQNSYVGRRFTLKQAIVNGRGKLSIDDTIWEIEGPDLPQDAVVTVTGVKDMRLVVEPSH